MLHIPKFTKPVGFNVDNGTLLKFFNMLGKSFADILLEDLGSLSTVDDKEVGSQGCFGLGPGRQPMNQQPTSFQIKCQIKRIIERYHILL